MEILITSATAGEVAPLREHLSKLWLASGNDKFTLGQTSVEFLITGIGMLRTAFHLGTRLAHSKPQLCINAGIAGAFPGKFEIGETVHIVQESLPELGAESPSGEILSVVDIGLSEDISSYSLVNEGGADYNFLPQAKGITVNTVHGQAKSIEDIVELHDPDVETMEGAAFFYACLKSNVPFLAIRSVSNIVEPRNRDNWNVPLAVTNLNSQLVEMLELLKS